MVIHQTGGGVTPNQTIFLEEKKKVFQGPHRTILGHPKHVVEGDLANEITTLFRIFFCETFPNSDELANVTTEERRGVL